MCCGHYISYWGFYSPTTNPHRQTKEGDKEKDAEGLADK